MANQRIDMERFDGKGDFSLWKRRMLAHLSLLGVKDALEEPATPLEGRLLREWLERSDKAFNLLVTHLGDYVLRKTEDCTTAATLWSTLERLYLSKTLPNRINQQLKYYTFRMSDSKSLDENIDDFLKLNSVLKAMGIIVPEEVQAVLLLGSLPSQFTPLRDTLKYAKGTLTLEEVVEAARTKDLEFKESRDSNTSQRNGESYFVRGRSEKRETYKNRSKSRSKSRPAQSSGSKITCWFCKKDGHLKKDCFLRKKKYENEDNGDAAVMVDELEEIEALSIATRNPEDRWVIDSGCSYHMTSRRDWFESFETVSSGQVFLGDDRTVSVQGIGTIRIQADGGTVKKLTNVRYIPDLKRNLISVGTLDLQGFKQAGGNGKTKFYKNNKLALQGTLTGTLYLLDGQTITGESNAAVAKDDTVLWHRRLGHTSIKNLKILATKGCLENQKITELEFCESCIMGKAKRLSFNIGKHHSKEVLRYVHADLWGSSNVQVSLSKKQYFLSLIDDYSKKVWIYFLATKDEAFHRFCEWKSLVENQSNKKVKCLRTDNGLEFCNALFDEFCRKNGIERHRTCPYTPQQNGVAERMNRTIMEKVRCLLDESGLEEKFWAEAAATSVYLINRTPSCANDGNIPEELWLGRQPGYSHLRRFGALVYIHTNQGKLKPRALKGIFIGYPEGVKGYKVWLLEEKKCVISRNAIFVEDKVYKDTKIDKDAEPAVTVNCRGGQNEITVDMTAEVEDTDENLETIPEGGANEIPEDPEGGVNETNSEDTEEEIEDGDDLSTYMLARDRVRRHPVPPTRYSESNIVAFALIAAEELIPEEPTSYEEAKRSKKWSKWEEGMKEEMNSLLKNETWSLTKLPKDHRAIGCKWIMKLKPEIPGVEKTRYKARLVAKGYSQKEGVDYQEIFAPVVKHVSIRLLLAITVNDDLELEQLDVKTAFLHGKIEEEIYMHQPEGFVVKGKENLVCRLHKALYGLKQAPRQWNKCFDQFMIKQGFTKSSYDHCVYFKKLKHEDYIYLLLYVDDMLVAAKSIAEVNKLKDMLKKEFEMKDLGPAKRILGMDIKRDREKGYLSLSQSNYIEKILQAFRMSEAKAVSTPIGAHFKLASIKEDEENDEAGEFPYCNAVGSIMYAMIGTRLDVAYAIGLVSRFMCNPGHTHWTAVQWILRYLKGTKNKGLVFKKGQNCLIEGYSDSDFAADLDRRRSITGYVFTVGGNAVSWKSNLQHVVALSTTEAEYIALVEAIKEAMWLKGLMEELGFSQEAVDIWCDSQSAICLSKNNVHHERTKHVDVKMHFVRDVIEKGEISVKKIHTSKNPADAMTKAIPVQKFEQALAMLNVLKTE